MLISQIAILVIAGLLAAMVQSVAWKYKAPATEPNHECWVKCTDCGTEYDRRLYDDCPECRCKNFTY